MFAICGYNFCRDGNALDATPLTDDSYTTTTLANGIFQHWNVTRDVTSDYSTQIPTAWDFLTIMDANFNGNIEAGNTDASLAEIDGMKLKRRKKGEFDWITLKYFPIEDSGDLSFVFQDNLAQNGVEYEWAFVPISGGVEGDYITNSLKTEFNGVFICDMNTIYRFYAGVSYGNQERVQQVGVFEPYGRKYPVVVSNGVVGYDRGSLQGTVLPNDYLKTKALDNVAMKKEQDALKEFLTNKKPKILKDWSNNYWLMMITDNPTLGFLDNPKMSLASMSASWVEVGDANSQKDLYNAGLVSEAE